jgi:uncharacterized protein (DUF433 family)
MDVNVISAFTEEQVAHLTGLSVSQLRYWDRTKFLIPSYAEENRRVPYSRIYSFKDIASLRVIGILRNQNSVSLQHLRDVAAELQRLSDDGWTTRKLYVFRKRVAFDDPETGQPREVVGGQYIVASVVLKSVFADTERDIADLMKRPSDAIGQIARSRLINHNEPVIAGTRISTGAIKRFTESGYSIDQIMEEYPDLTREDIDAALNYEANPTAA